VMELTDPPATRPAHDRLPAGLHGGCDCGEQPELPDYWRRGFTRRRVLQGGTALVAALGLQTVTSRYAFSASPALDTDTMLMINLRGGWDSLNIVVPAFESDYYQQRPNIAVPKQAALPLSQGFGLHPSLKDLHPRFKAGQLAFVVGVTTPDTTLSHFEAMDTLERGTASGLNSSGWLNRVLQARGQHGVFSAVQFGSQLPLALTGEAPALALDGVQSFGLAGYDDVLAQAASAYAGLYDGIRHPMADQVTDTLKAVGTVAKLRGQQYQPSGGAAYPQGSGLGTQLQDVARLVKAKVGLTVASLDVGGWDMHTGEGRIDGGDLKNHLDELNAALNAFVVDLGPAFANVTVMMISEFGRTVRENGSGGTDHGHGQAMWVLGGGIRGGRVYGRWPGVSEREQYTNGSLGGSTDYRDVLADVLSGRGGVGSFASIFPDHRPRSLGIARQRG
jgi:uncharacterized protein (DUF1501 family)